MTNFLFLLPEFKPLYEPAKGAEPRVINATASRPWPHPDAP
jgi:hypothetical protein